MSNFHFSPRPNRANEIRWREWGESAFQEAREQDKPILLDLSAVWCHWCHVMDETTYSDPEIIQILNDHFIPIRVDNDQRPDVNRRYNLGGWPTTALLTPDGEILTGGTYVPAEQMRTLLPQVRDAFKQSKQQIQEKVKEIALERAESQRARAAAKGTLSQEIVNHVLKEILNHFDSLYGGLGHEPKFPQTEAFELVLAKYFEERDPVLLSVVTLTLNKMASGGMYDQEAGGFFRYSTTRDWSVPHFEKMLEDNAKLLRLYVHTWQVTRDELLLKTIRSLIGYLDSTLTDSVRGGFYGSQDADEDYYALSLAERASHPAPFVDHTFYTDWNALMVSTYLDAAHSLDPQREEGGVGSHLRSQALWTLKRIWNEMYHADVGLYHYARENDTPQLTGLLSDLAHTTTAFLDAYWATADGVYLERAQILADLALARLYDADAGGFWSESVGNEALGLVRTPDKSLNENAAMAQALMKLDRLTGNERYRAPVEKSLDYFTPDYGRLSFLAADYALAVERFLNEPITVRIVGPLGDKRTRALEIAALKEYAPGKIVQTLDPSRDAGLISQFGYTVNGTPLAFVCVGTKCLAPVSEPAQVEEGIKSIRR